MEGAYEGTGPGKTGPRLLEDLLDYDCSLPRTNGSNVLIDPAPIYKQNKSYPPRTYPNDCHHFLYRKDWQTSIPPFDKKPTTQTQCISASYCSFCLHHFDVVVDYTRQPGKNIPCRAGTSHPLHHFQYVGSEFQTQEELKSPENKYDNHKEQHAFKCSAFSCPATVTIRISPPRLSRSQSALLLDPRKVYARGAKVIEEDPDRYGESRPSLPCEVLAVIRTYLTHALTNAPGESKRIAARNKRFLLAFGYECKELLEYLGFTYEQERVMNGDVEEEEGFWSLPAVSPSTEPTGAVVPKTNRNFVEDVLCEVSQRLADRPPEELKQGNSQILYNPLPALKDLRIALGFLGFPTDNRVVNLEANEHPHYASLGAISSFSDELIFFAYSRQRDCDPSNKPYYLECLQGIGKGRGSPFLEEEFVKIVSLGENTLTEIEEAYRFFALNPAIDHGDDHIIGVYKSRIENAPLQKDQAKRALLLIGKARNSAKIQEVANNRAVTYEEALEYLSVTADTPSDFIEAQAIAMATDVDKSIVAPMLSVIGNTRRDLSLQIAAASMEAGNVTSNLSLKEAYKRLQIQDENTSEESVFAYYQTLIDGAPLGSKESFLEAIRVIAKSRNSNFLFAKINDPNAIVAPQRSTADQPVGLDNIGNTCYLNSLLQYYYTVRPVRDVVMNFEDFRMPLTAESILKKRVGGRAVGKGEIVKAQNFAVELQTLYKSLKSASTQSVKPTQDLAELTLFSTATEANFRRASISSPSAVPNMNDNDERPIFGPHLPPPPPPPKDNPPSSPAPPATASAQLEPDVEMTDEPTQETLDNDDSSSQITLVNPESKKNSATPSVDMSNATDLQQDLPHGLPSAEPPGMAHAPIEAPSLTVSAGEQVRNGNDEVMANAVSLTPPPESMEMVEQRPPVPPRNKPAPIKTGESEEDLRAQKLNFGAQQDVTEVIGNVIFRLQCAIKPTRIDPKFGEQIDVVRETFFGSNAVHLKKADSYDVKIEDWGNIIVFPGSDGERDIYEALDVVFDEQVVEIDNSSATQFASINSLPPIVQIQIQRTAFDPATQQASKNQNRIVFDETIYLDRYMEDEKILQRRRDAWVWKNRIRLLEARQKALQVTDVDVPVEGTLHATKDFLQSLGDEQVGDIAINPDLASTLEERANEISNEMAAISKEISSLKLKLQEQFTDLRQHRYRLQAVFIHRGTNAYGHYWIYIYDFAQDIWREYNDERVSIVEDRTRVFGQPGTGGATPYYLVYVRDEDKDDIVDAVCRELHEEAPTETNEMVQIWNNGQVDHDEAIDMGNGAQHVEDYEHFETKNSSSSMDLSGMGAWDGMQAGFNGKK
ncbi:hypothetical protein V493_04054 [Pseudogymnoascus sp. VKM F-4281 (FW-2241)]|nr:hypothetical protein V493_04054 [Pseudogymnoascus sp. VKM F-4281 (FW-2241)]